MGYKLMYRRPDGARRASVHNPADTDMWIDPHLEAVRRYLQNEVDDDRVDAVTRAVLLARAKVEPGGWQYQETFSYDLPEERGWVFYLEKVPDA